MGYQKLDEQCICTAAETISKTPMHVIPGYSLNYWHSYKLMQHLIASKADEFGLVLYQLVVRIVLCLKNNVRFMTGLT